MGDVLSSLPIYMMIGIILVIGISQFNRMIGGMLGVVFWTAVAIVGTSAYDQGHAIGLLGYKFSKTELYILCALFAGFSGFTAYMAYVKKTRFRPPPPRDDSSASD